MNCVEMRRGGGHPHAPGRGVPLHPRKGYELWRGRAMGDTQYPAG